MKKNVNPMATCHDIGACLLHADDCACMRACTLQARKPRRLANDLGWDAPVWRSVEKVLWNPNKNAAVEMPAADKPGQGSAV